MKPEFRWLDAQGHKQESRLAIKPSKLNLNSLALNAEDEPRSL
jgi:hypothetical protein